MANSSTKPFVVAIQSWISLFLLAGLSLSGGLFFLVRNLEQRQADELAAEVVRKQVEKLEITFLRSMEVLNGVAALHAARSGLTRAEFGGFVAGALQRQPELQALSWNPVVTAVDRAAFEASARAEGLVEYQLREEGGGSDLVRAGLRGMYVPVRWIEPLQGNQDALGYDLNSEGSRRESLERARDTGLPVATAPLDLAQESHGGPGLLVLMPVFHAGEAGNVEQRRALLAGFAVAVFRLGDLVNSSLRELAAQGISARLSNGGVLVESEYASRSNGADGLRVDFQQVRHFEVAGRRWSIAFTPGSVFYRGANLQAWVVLIGGLAFTGFGAYHVQTGARRVRQIAAAHEALRQEMVERTKAEAAADAANQAKSDFLANMSHEIRTPLNAILGHAQLMQRDPALSVDQQDAIAGINVSGQHLLGLINEVLDLAKIEAGKMEPLAAPTDLGGVIRGLEATFKPLCARNRVSFRARLDSAAPAVVLTDEGKLRQILINLLGNALKFTAAGAITLTIRTREDGLWLFEVSDTGPGIPPDEREGIFEPFRQGRGTCRDGGSGLGLAIAQRQVELLGGRLELVSEQGVGSKFFFELPLAPAALEPSTVILPVRHLRPGVRVRALVVDDQPENQVVLAGLLECVGCEVFNAADAEQAVRVALDRRPDVAFLDLLMPGRGGAELARRLRDIPVEGGRGAMVLIAQTAACVARHLHEAREAGCVDCLSKPLEAERVYAALERHCGVVFERAPCGAGMTPLAALDGPKITLPEELCARLAVAAELHSATALKAALKDLRQRGEHAVLLAEHIRHLMRSYDMDAIQRLLASTVVTGVCPTGMPEPHE